MYLQHMPLEISLSDVIIFVFKKVNLVLVILNSFTVKKIVITTFNYNVYV